MDKKTLTITFLLLPCLLFGQTVNIDSSSIGTASRDYSTIQGWEDAKDGDLVTADTTRKGVCFNDATFSETVIIDGSTTSDSTYMWLTVASGERHNGTEGTGATISASANWDVLIEILDQFIIAEFLELDGNNFDNAKALRASIGSANFTARYLLVYDFNLTAGPSAFVIMGNTTANVYNNIIYNGGVGAGIFVENWYQPNVYNNTVYNSQRGIEREGASGTFPILRNNIAVGNTTDYAGNFNASSDYNLSSDATAPGSNSLINITTADQFVSITGGSEDLHLKSGADAIDAGTDLSGTFTDDIDGVTRSGTWDMGADEFVAAPASGTPATPKKARPRFWGLLLNNQNSPSTFWIAGAIEQLLKRRFLL